MDMATDGDPFKPNPSDFRTTPAGRVIAFLMGLMFLLVHGMIWLQVLSDSPMLPEHAEHEPVLFLGLAGTTMVVLGATGFSSLLLFWVAIHREWRPRAADPDPTVPMAGEGIAAPPDVAIAPMMAGLTGSSAYRIVRPGPEVLMIAPSRGTYVMIAMLFTLAAVLWFFTWLAFVGIAEYPLVTAAGGLFCFGIGVLMLCGLSRHVFDNGRGAYRRSNVVLRWPIATPFRDLRAVQLLTEVPRELKEAENRKRRYVAFQVNLVLSDPDRPRLHIFEDSDRDQTIRIARELAGFLGLPIYRTAMPPRDS